MQARAIFEAAAEVGRSSKKLPVAEVMVPWAATPEELKLLKGIIEKTAEAVKKEQGITFTYKVFELDFVLQHCFAHTDKI